MSLRHGKVEHFLSDTLESIFNLPRSNEMSKQLIVYSDFKIIVCYRELSITEQQNNHINGKADISITGTQYLKIIHPLLQFLFHCSVEIGKHIE
jgi:hypothetical protein